MFHTEGYSKIKGKWGLRETFGPFSKRRGDCGDQGAEDAT